MKLKINWDALGVTASLACAVHCALLPLVLTSLPLFGVNIIDNSRFELMMIFVAFSIGVYALLHGLRKHHGKKLPLLLFSGGMLCLFAKQRWHEWQLWFLIPAVLLILSAHYLNFRLTRKKTSGAGQSAATC